MEKYLQDWITIIEQMNNDNTYKLAWGRAIIECVYYNEYSVLDNGNVKIDFDSISKCMIRYYWNQLFFFNLKQSSNNNKPPVVCQKVDELIKEYKNITHSNIPVWYDEGLKVINKYNKKMYEKIVKEVSKALTENVSWRFKNISNGRVLDIYEYKKNKREIILDTIKVNVLKEYGVLISKLLNYKWAQLLEKYNFAPKIVSKVNDISFSKIKRNSLREYKEELIKQFENGKIIDFYTNKIIDEKDVSIDHVIPWSFMYSDDIWNLVITSKSNNSSKSNSIPSEEVIARLKERNELLLNILEGKYKEEIKLSLENNYLDRCYFDCRL